MTSSLLRGHYILALQVVRTVHTIRQDTYGNDYQPIARFLEQNNGPATSVLGPPELAFAVGFDRFSNDGDLAFYTCKRPELIIIEKRDQARISEAGRLNPQFGKYVNNLLQHDYQLVSAASYVLIYRKQMAPV